MHIFSISVTLYIIMLMQSLYLLVLLCFIQGLRGTPPLSLGSSFYLPSQSLTEELHKGFQIFSESPHFQNFGMFGILFFTVPQ